MTQRRMLMLFLAILLAIPGLSVSAQTPVAEGPPPNEELVGLQQAVWRLYGPAGAFEGSAVISLDEATPAGEQHQLRSLSVVVREFDTKENASAAYEPISAGTEALAENVFMEGTQEATAEEVPDIGSQASLVRLDHAENNVEMWIEQITVQRDQYVFFISVDASVFTQVPGSEDVDKSLPTMEIASAIVSEDEASPDEPIHEEDGTSTGGLWGFMPEEGDPVLRGLVPVQDIIIFPAPEA